MNADPRLLKKGCGDLWPIRLAAGESSLVQSLAQLEGNHHIVPKEYHALKMINTLETITSNTHSLTLETCIKNRFTI
jgi:hypothetical protein